MEEYQQMTARQRKWMFYLLAILVLGWGVTPWQPVFLGLLLGSIISFYNLWLMQKKIKKFGEPSTKDKPQRGLGTITRMATAALAVVVTLQFEEHFHLISVVLGLMTAYFVILIDYLFNKATD
ncbi:ATP synthase subunit I [Halobacillus sp. A5]|uniref:ATP synthase subunit I n=1 Tax=Halobacillus sp. A5 TaxID=2880263 RepID=UPI0020A6B7B4|nr:ATP synthase subunit I [Halobacillus sp. A5]MCP3027579.1 ATP synthase subunit I [Halobacillus sp. A5]